MTAPHARESKDPKKLEGIALWRSGHPPDPWRVHAQSAFPEDKDEGGKWKVGALDDCASMGFVMALVVPLCKLVGCKPKLQKTHEAECNPRTKL